MSQVDGGRVPEQGIRLFSRIRPFRPVRPKLPPPFRRRNQRRDVTTLKIFFR
jgi:hypothetical protein